MAANAGAEPAEQNEKPPKQRQRQRQLCEKCNIDGRRAVTKRVVTQKPLCKDCFINDFEEDVHAVITAQSLFRRGERVAVGASGGKDSTVLAHVLTRLNARYDYGIEILLLSIDEGIAGYRDDSLASVRRNERRYEVPLTVVSYSEVYGWTMDDIVRHVGRKNNCTFCGVFRRQALDRGAALLRADKIATGHNADDVAETVLLNLLRGDLPRLTRCTQITTAAAAPDADGASWSVPRCKPLMYAYEKEIVQYAHYNRLDYFSTECVYSPFAYRGFVRDFIKDLERIRPRAILDIIRSAECFCVDAGSNGAARMPQQGVCERCGYIASQKWCKACVLLDGLNRGLPKLGISRTRNRRSSANAKAQDEAPPPTPTPTPTPPALPPTDSYHHRRPMWPAAAFSAPLVAAFLRVSIILFPLNSAVTNTLAMAVRNFVTRSIIQTVYNLTRYVEGMILMYSELWRYLLLRLEIDMIFHASYLCILTFDRFNRGHLG